MTLTCACGAINRIPKLPTKRIRCGKCGHVFTPRELLAAKKEAPPAQPDMAELLKMFFGNSEPDDVEVEEND